MRGPEHPERAIACPNCLAKPGSPCMRPSGHRVFGGGSHAGRSRAFFGSLLGRKTSTPARSVDRRREMWQVAESILDHLGGCDPCRDVGQYGARHARPCRDGAMLRTKLANATYSSCLTMGALGTADRKRLLDILRKLRRAR